jgi:hypothetical protein
VEWRAAERQHREHDDDTHPRVYADVELYLADGPERIDPAHLLPSMLLGASRTGRAVADLGMAVHVSAVCMVTRTDLSLRNALHRDDGQTDAAVLLDGLPEACREGAREGATCRRTGLVLVPAVPMRLHRHESPREVLLASLPAGGPSAA